MPFHIQQIAPDRLAEYEAVPIAFRVESVLRLEVVAGGLVGLRLVEEPLAEPYVKDYDGHGKEESGLSPIWPGGADLSTWGLFLARDGGRAIGGAAVTVETESLYALEGRPELAVLWDIRVHPAERSRGIGRALFWRAASWARQQGCTQLKIETQNVNVPACRFYLAQGCELGAIHRYGYAGCPDVAHEAMLLWYLDLQDNKA